MSAEREALGVFGAGWVGLVTGACFADLGHRVVIRDVVPEKIEALRSGSVPFHEPGLAGLIEKNRERLTFTLDVDELKAESRIFFSCVDTPPLPSGEADLARVWSVVEDLGAPEGATLVMKSTVPVGTGERIRGKVHPAVGYVSNPEFLSEARGIEDFMHPDRIVIGAFEDEHGDRVAALYDALEAPVVRTSVASAEMIKLASNAFLATRISFINEIANVSEAVGADVDEVVSGMGLDRRIGSSYLRPGIGYGGSCFPKDVSFLKLLAGSSGYEFRLLSSVIDVNDEQPRRVVAKLQARLGDLAGKRVAVLGLAFKPDTNDMRDAPSLVLVGLLRAQGAEVRAWDPLVTGHPKLNGALVGTSALEAVTGADAAVIVTEWHEIASIANAETLEAMRTPLIIDGRNFLDPDAVRAAGFEYEGIGRA
jgi:UDPglucose 6-dehydrogenase